MSRMNQASNQIVINDFLENPNDKEKCNAFIQFMDSLTEETLRIAAEKQKENPKKIIGADDYHAITEQLLENYTLNSVDDKKEALTLVLEKLSDQFGEDNYRLGTLDGAVRLAEQNQAELLQTQSKFKAASYFLGALSAGIGSAAPHLTKDAGQQVKMGFAILTATIVAIAAVTGLKAYRLQSAANEQGIFAQTNKTEAEKAKFSSGRLRALAIIERRINHLDVSPTRQ